MSIDAQADHQAAGAIPRREIEVEVVGFDGFFTREYPRLVTLLTAITGRRTVAEEIAQEAMLRAQQRWGRISGYDLPAAWVRRVALNLASQSQARRHTERLTLERLASQRAPAPFEVAGDEFWSIVRQLPRRQAAAVVLHYLEDRPVVEVAAILGCAEGTAKAHLHKGRASLARLLENPETPHGP